MYSIEFTQRARREFLRLEVRTRERLAERVDRLSEWPVRALDIRPLRGRLAGAYRLRVGQYRVIFIVDEERQRISVREVGHRGSIY